MTLMEVAGECSVRMEEIGKFFKKGAEVTLIVRSPGHPDRDFMLTNDSLDEIRGVLDRRDPTKP